MAPSLEPTDKLFVIGTQQDWFEYTAVVPPSQISLLAPPCEGAWEELIEDWDFPEGPSYSYGGGIGGLTTDHDSVSHEFFEPWPPFSKKTMELDVFVARTGLAPTAIAIDVMGAEYHVLVGARQTLAHYRPKIYISIYPDQGFEQFGVEEYEVPDLLAKLGYEFDHYATVEDVEYWSFW